MQFALKRVREEDIKESNKIQQGVKSSGQLDSNRVVISSSRGTSSPFKSTWRYYGDISSRKQSA
jgi:hypothetical protein